MRIEKAAPIHAPPAIPSIYGSASGFLSNPWKAEPTIASDPPANIARISLGSLNLSIREEGGLPIKREMNDTMTSSKKRMENMRIFFI